MPIENRNLKPGAKLIGRYHKQSYSCEVVENAEGKAPLQTGGWPGIQESLGCRNGHHRACLRRLGLLAYGNGRNHCHPECRESRSCPCRRDRTERGTCGRTYSECYQDRPKENRSISSPQSEGSTGRSDSLVLPGLRQELYHLGSRDTRDLSDKAPDQITPPDNHLIISKRALFHEGLFRFSPPKTTIGALTSRGGQRW